MLMIWGAAVLQTRKRRLRQLLDERPHQPRFANARFPTEYHPLAAALLHLDPALLEQSDFDIPPDQGR